MDQKPPKYPIQGREVVLRLGKMPPYPVVTGASELELKKRWNASIRLAAMRARRRYSLTVWKDPATLQYLYDADEVERVKATIWERHRTN